MKEYKAGVLGQREVLLSRAYTHICVSGQHNEPEDHVPLAPLVFEVLLTLAAGEQHGYRIMRDVAERSRRRHLHAGTLYRTLARLLEPG